jgi:antitoxin (DNA-binding transcriptional repressor) of toxin-antitoxin stability system
MKKINASEFRQKCLSLMDDLPAEGILITKLGHPVAKLIPVRQSSADLIGSVPGIVLDPEDDLFSTRMEWDAES